MRALGLRIVRERKESEQVSLINNSRNTPKREQKVANRNNKGQIREGNQLGTKGGGECTLL